MADAAFKRDRLAEAARRLAKEADTAVPALNTPQDFMNHYVLFNACVEKHDYRLGVNARELHK
jgi:hypothetical protein